jgi:hypothetical protein
VTANNLSKTYDGAAYNGNSGFSYSSDVSNNLVGTLTYGGNARGSSNAGTYEISLSGLYSNQQGYLIKYVPGTLIVAQAPVSISGVRFYDGTGALAAGIFNLSGLVIGQDLTFSGSGSMADKHVGLSKAVNLETLALRNGDVGSSSNYTLVGGTHKVRINAAALTITAGSISKTYDGTLAAEGTGSVTSGSLFGTDALSSSGLAYTDKNAGNDNKTVTATGVNVLNGDGSANHNYNVTYVSNTNSSINTRTLDVIAQAKDKVYDGKTTASVTLSDNRVAGDVLTLSLKPSLTGSATSGSYISIINADGSSTQIVSGSSGANFADKNAAIDKTVFVVGIQVQGTDARNYAANTTALSTANITPKGLTVLAVGQDKAYDGNATGLVKLSSSGVFKGDNLLLAGIGAFANSNAGTDKAVAVSSITATGGDAGNYSLNNTSASTTADITPKIITVVAVGTDKVYDGTTSSTAVLSSSGVLAQDSTNVQFNAAAAFTNKNVGVGKTVAVTNISASGSQSGNYQIKNSTAKASATVTAKSIIVSASGSNKVYDGDTSGVVILSSNDVVSGDKVSLASTSAEFSDKNVGNGKAVTVSGISLKGTDASNYTANTSALSTANITPKGIAVTATGGTMVYNATLNTPVTLASTGVVKGDNVGFTNIAALLDNKNVGKSKLVTVSGISAFGNDALNYSLNNTTAMAKATVTTLSITVAASGVTKTSDNTTNATVSLQSGGVLAGDLVSFSSTTAKFANSAVGVNKVVKVSGIRALGTDAMNYRVANTTASTMATITP